MNDKNSPWEIQLTPRKSYEWSKRKWHHLLDAVRGMQKNTHEGGCTFNSTKLYSSRQSGARDVASTLDHKTQPSSGARKQITRRCLDWDTLDNNRPATPVHFLTCCSRRKSWLMTMTPPSNCLIALAMESIISMEAWFVGSSSNKICGLVSAISENTSRVLKPSLCAPEYQH